MAALYLGSRAQLYLARLWDWSQWQAHLLGSNLCLGAQSAALRRHAHLHGDRWCSSSIVRQLCSQEWIDLIWILVHSGQMQQKHPKEEPYK